jgi:Bifunctional DNA primase/polymerase, N-terminal/Primase C terminal 1 (PriCT-1)
MNGIFEGAQPVYAEHGIATFPVGADKKPAITHYQRVGLRGSGQLVARHAHAIGLGFMSNARNRIAVLDYDDTDERGFADALNRHGDTPIKVKTASGKWHAYYRHNGERRLIRGLDALPIDVLGSGGFAVAPPSEVPDKGTYQFIEGGLDDLGRLPVMRNLPPHVYGKQDVVIGPETIPEGKRNDVLWRQCMREARRVNGFDELLNAARTFNLACLPPLNDGDVVQTAQSAWSYEENGLNRFGQQGAWIPGQEYDELLSQPDGLVVVNLFVFLRRHQAPSAEFMCTNSLAERLGCPEKRVATARRRLIQLGYIKPTRRAGRGTPALFVWAPKKGRSYD